MFALVLRDKLFEIFVALFRGNDPTRLCPTDGKSTGGLVGVKPVRPVPEMIFIVLSERGDKRIARLGVVSVNPNRASMWMVATKMISGRGLEEAIRAGLGSHSSSQAIRAGVF